jgi:hypothetical protein
LRILGITVASLEIDNDTCVVAEESDDAARIEGGSAHNFERDGDPLSPTSHHEWEWEDRKGFGFR